MHSCAIPSIHSAFRSSWGSLWLGSICALVPAGIGSLLLILRTRWEDRTLQAELPGYQEYAESVRFKLLPGVW